ncbi:MAG: hypothetical protein R3B93_06240 [Bacteroidia bacterium]
MTDSMMGSDDEGRQNDDEMMEMMHEQGMMSDECKQSCMNMMKDKGMM